VLFFAARYPPAVEGIFWLVYMIDVQSSEPFCKFEAYLAIWGTLIFLIPLQIIIIMRTMALWDKRRSITILVVTVAIAADITILVTLSRIMRAFTFQMIPLITPLLGCNSGLIGLSPTITIPSWVAVIVFDTVIFVLTLISAVHKFKYGRTRLLTILVRDGFMYYLVMLSLGVVNLLLLVALPFSRGGLSTMFTPVLRASFSIIGSRIMLNLRGAVEPLNSPSYGSASFPQHIVRLELMNNGGAKSSSSTGSEQTNTSIV